MSDTTMPKGQYYYAVGRRKTSVARVRLYPGEGNVIVNGKPARDHFGGRELHYLVMAEPFRVGKLQIKKLKIYEGTTHPHGAQNPATLELDDTAAR